MDAKQTLPPDVSSDYRRRFRAWHSLYDHDGTATTDKFEPNWAQQAAGLVGSLLQALPPTVNHGGDGDPSEQFAEMVEHVDPADVLDDAADRAAGLGAAFLRTVHDGIGWTCQVLDPSNVHATWTHRRLVQAVVWSVFADPREKANENTDKRLAIVETWDMSGEDGTTVDRELWECRKVTDTSSLGEHVELATQLEPTNLPDELRDVPAIAGMLADLDDERTDGDGEASTVPPSLEPFVWRWQRNHPAPVYAGQEQVFKGNGRLWNQEQDDAELARNRIAMSESMVATEAVRDSNGRVVYHAGFQTDSNVVLLKDGAGRAQAAGDKPPFEVINFPDDNTMRDRIESREAAAYRSIRISPSSVGIEVKGRTDSAAAKRADSQMTLATIGGPSRRAAKALTAVYRALAALWKVANPEGVAVAVHEGLKITEAEAAEHASDLAAAEAASTRTLVKTAHPTWSDTQIDEEVAAMGAEGRAVVADDDSPGHVH